MHGKGMLHSFFVAMYNQNRALSAYSYMTWRIRPPVAEMAPFTDSFPTMAIRTRKVFLGR